MQQKEDILQVCISNRSFFFERATSDRAYGSAQHDDAAGTNNGSASRKDIRKGYWCSKANHWASKHVLLRFCRPQNFDQHLYPTDPVG